MKKVIKHNSSGDLKEIAYDVAKARILIARGDLEGAQCLLDDAAERIPDKYWPSEQELADGDEIYCEEHPYILNHECETCIQESRVRRVPS